jgi:hypothetical protein
VTIPIVESPFSIGFFFYPENPPEDIGDKVLFTPVLTMYKGDVVIEIEDGIIPC